MAMFGNMTAALQIADQCDNLGTGGLLLKLAVGIYNLSHEFHATSNGGFANLVNRGE